MLDIQDELNAAEQALFLLADTEYEAYQRIREIALSTKDKAIKNLLFKVLNNFSYDEKFILDK